MSTGPSSLAMVSVLLIVCSVLLAAVLAFILSSRLKKDQAEATPDPIQAEATPEPIPKKDRGGTTLEPILDPGSGSRHRENETPEEREERRKDRRERRSRRKQDETPEEREQRRKERKDRRSRRKPEGTEEQNRRGNRRSRRNETPEEREQRHKERRSRRKHEGDPPPVPVQPGTEDQPGDQ